MIKFLMVLIFLYTKPMYGQVSAAVIDSGVNINNKYLKPFLVYHKKDGLQAYDFVNDKRKMEDEEGHGTHVAGLIFLDLDPKKFKLYPLKFTRKGEYENPNQVKNDYLNYIKSLKMAIGLKVDVINFSYRSGFRGFQEENLIKEAGENNIILVVAAGNDSQNLDEQPMYPCSYDYNHVICVGNKDSEGNRVKESNYGKAVDFYEEGDNQVGLGHKEDLVIKSGTSMATAKITRKILIYKEKNPKANLNDILNHLKSN